MKKSRVAILYICTGKYVVYWKNFFKSAEKYLLPGIEKHYFVFTDADKIYADKREDIHRIFQELLPFPKGSLMRFDMFLKIESTLAKFDYMFFFNSNIIFVNNILETELFPSSEENGLVGYLHSMFYNKKPEEYIYERNKLSTAFVPVGVGKRYYQGCLIGGVSEDFLEMCRVLDKNIKADLRNDFIAIWWDESHLNHYFLDKEVKLLHPGFCYPELLNLPFEKKAIMLNKTKMGLDYLRGLDNSLKGRVRFFLKRLINNKN